MSEQVIIVGKMKPYFKTFEGTTKEIIVQFCKENSLPIDESDVLDSWYDNYGDKFIIFGNTVYSIIKKTQFDYSDVFQATVNKQDEVEFTLSYYNGGCCFQEALETALKNMQK